MMGSEIVCQVIGRSDQVTFIWSEGPASFEPYQLTGQGFVAFRNLANQSREALSVLVKDYLQGTDDDLRRSGFALAKVGFKLYQQIFRPAAGPSQYVAKRARDWLVELYGYNQIKSLEIVMDGFGPIPWNVIYDKEPKEADFLSGECVECWRPFWGLRYNLAGGRRVEPLRRLPWLVNPKLLMVIDPSIHAGLPDEQKLRLEEFVLEHNVRVAVTKEALASEMEERRPDVMYWLCHASAEALILNGEEVSPGDLLDLFRSQADDDRLGGIAFLNACQTAEATEEGGSFMDALHEVGLSGVIATEQQTVDTFAHPFGLDFLEAFLYEGRPIGELLHDLRSKGVPLGLLYSTYCPPGLRVLKAEGSSDERKILAASRLPGVALSASASSFSPRTKLKEARRATTPRDPVLLPDAPYRLLAPFERRDRALFVGRDDDIRRFTLILDDPRDAAVRAPRRERRRQVLVPQGRRDPVSGRRVRRLPVPVRPIESTGRARAQVHPGHERPDRPDGANPLRFLHPGVSLPAPLGRQAQAGQGTFEKERRWAEIDLVRDGRDRPFADRQGVDRRRGPGGGHRGRAPGRRWTFRAPDGGDFRTAPPGPGPGDRPSRGDLHPGQDRGRGRERPAGDGDAPQGDDRVGQLQGHHLAPDRVLRPVRRPTPLRRPGGGRPPRVPPGRVPGERAGRGAPPPDLGPVDRRLGRDPLREIWLSLRGRRGRADRPRGPRGQARRPGQRPPLDPGHRLAALRGGRASGGGHRPGRSRRDRRGQGGDAPARRPVGRPAVPRPPVRRPSVPEADGPPLPPTARWRPHDGPDAARRPEIGLDGPGRLRRPDRLDGRPPAPERGRLRHRRRGTVGLTPASATTRWPGSPRPGTRTSGGSNASAR